MNQIIIFTDGSSRGNPGPGGWGSVIVAGDVADAQGAQTALVIELGGAEKNTTNNRMELEAVIAGLENIFNPKIFIQDGMKIKVYTDSSYVINGITKWIFGWKRNGWKTQTKEDVLNKDLWMELDRALVKIFDKVGPNVVNWKYVGGHVGVAGNERCDVIATAFADGEEIDLYDGPLESYSIKNILNILHDAMLAKAKKSSSSRSNAKAYSYVSAIGGKVQIHNTWAECEKRVKGAKGARYKKALNSTEESSLIAEFGRK